MLMRKSLKKTRFAACMILHPWEHLMRRAGFDYDIVKLINDYYRDDFDKAPLKDTAVFLPHCLVDDKCPAKFSKEDGLICSKCMKCNCGEIKKLCEERGIQFYISPSSGFSQRLAQRKKLQAAIGAICLYDLEKSLRNVRLTGRGVSLKSRKVIPQIVLAAHYDCLNNDIDWEYLKEIIARRS
jgi:hypothetical protein